MSSSRVGTSNRTGAAVVTRGGCGSSSGTLTGQPGYSAGTPSWRSANRGTQWNSTVLAGKSQTAVPKPSPRRRSSVMSAGLA